MNVHEARALLGVGPEEGWDGVRLAYRRLIRELHPDLAGPEAHDRAAQLNEAYGVLSRALGGSAVRGRRPVPSTPRRSGSSDAPAPPRMTAYLEGTDRLIVDGPPDEAFTRLLEAGHAVGAVSYVDRSCSIFEVVVRHEGEACSLVVSLQRRGSGTEAWCTLESLERVAQPSPEPIMRQLVAALQSPWLSPPHMPRQT